MRKCSECDGTGFIGGDQWVRPGPIAEVRVTGRWPSQSFYSVWSDALWQSVQKTRYEIDPRWPVAIGADIARFGDALTSIIVRKGYAAVHAEAHSGWSTDMTAGRLKILAHQWSDANNKERAIPILIDSTGGFGGGVVDQAGGYSFVGINSSEKSSKPDRWRNTRSELWFTSVDYAKQGLLDVSRLPRAMIQEIGRQLLAPTYSVDAAGRQVVEEKAQTVKRIKCSPDLADSFNLTYFPVSPFRGERVVGSTA